jgi:hypothetical protein
MVICHFGTDIAKENENWLLLLKNSVRGGFLAIESTEKLSLALRKK